MDSKPRASVSAKNAPRVPGTSRDKAKKSSKRHNSRKEDPNSKKKHKRKGDKDGLTPAGGSKKKRKNESGSTLSAYTDDDTSDEEAAGETTGYPKLPEIGDEIAIKCPPDPPYPEGWYTGVVVGVIVHNEVSGAGRSKASKDKMKQNLNFTVHIEWDGGGDEEIVNPEWRKKSDAPDKQGRVSHRDARLRPYFKYWVNRLNAMNEAEKKLGRTRAGKNTRLDPDQKIEWIQCSSCSCGKWRALPPFMKSSAILESCNNQWYCVLNSWDEAHASCGAPQETGYMPPPAANNNS